MYVNSDAVHEEGLKVGGPWSFLFDVWFRPSESAAWCGAYRANAVCEGRATLLYSSLPSPAV